MRVQVQVSEHQSAG